MQLSIPTRSLLPRAGPYSRAIVGYGIHWNHPAECTTPARGSCRPSLDIYLRIFPLACSDSGITSAASSIFSTAREVCFVMRFTGTLWVFGGHSKFFPAWTLVSDFLERQRKPEPIIWTYVLSVKYLASSSWIE